VAHQLILQRRRPQARHPLQAIGQLVIPAVPLLLLVWWLVQMLPLLTQAGPTTNGLAGAPTAVEDGSLVDTLSVVSFAALGLLFARSALSKLTLPAVRLCLALLGCYLVWSFASIVWSIDPGLSFRRAVKLLLLVVGAVGLGLGYYGSRPNGPVELARHVLIAALVALAVLWLPQIQSRQVDFLDPAFSLKDVGFGTPVAFPLAYGACAAIYLGSVGALRPGLVWAYVVACFVSLFAQKVRIIVAATVLLVGIQLLLTLRPRQRAILLGAILALAVVAFVILTWVAPQLGPQLGDTIWQYVTLDQSTTTTQSIDGRAPLWQLLVGFVAERPVLGYGFGAFWNPSYMAYVWDVVHWQAVIAHNGFLDEVLATGAIGLVLFLAFWLAGIGLAARASRHPFGLLVLCWLVLFVLFNLGDSIMQSYFRFPFYASVLALFALLGAHWEPADGNGRHRPISARRPGRRIADWRVAGEAVARQASASRT
jgi:O-antigen ligase